jgi:hypothetical protein
MAKKGGSKGKKEKVGPKAKASAKKGPELAAASEEQPQVDDYAQNAARGVKRRLNRRSTDEAVERVIMEKLTGRYSEESVSGKTNERGQSVREFIGEAIRENRSDKAKLGTAFWLKLFQEFSLEKKECDGLPNPDAGEAVRDEVIAKLTCCHDPNPATRSVEPLIGFLQFCSELQYVELYGLIMGCQESPTITKGQSTKLLLAILGCITRLGREDVVAFVFDACSTRFSLFAFYCF